MGGALPSAGSLQAISVGTAPAGMGPGEPHGPGKLAPASEDCDGEGRGGGRGGRSHWHGPGTETCVRLPGADADHGQTVARALRGSSVESKREWNWNSPGTRSRGPGGEAQGPPSMWGAALGTALGGPRRAQPSTTCLHPDRQVRSRFRGSQPGPCNKNSHVPRAAWAPAIDSSTVGARVLASHLLRETG